MIYQLPEALMDYQVPVEIAIQAPVEKHDVRADVVEMVARLLARAPGFRAILTRISDYSA